MTSYSVMERVFQEFAPEGSDPDIIERQIDHMLEGYVSWRSPDGVKVELHGGGSGKEPCYLGEFHSLDHDEMSRALTEALQEWYDAELRKLMEAVVNAARTMGELQVKPDSVELHKAREVPRGLGTLFGLRIRRTDGPERIMSAPEFGRFVTLQVAP
jgi:hypothetical protein